MSEAAQLTGAEGMKKLGDLIAEIRFAMLTTAAPDGTIDSRPMATQKTEFQGSVWFLTAHDSRKVGEIADNDHVSLIYADPGNASYVTVKGHGYVSHDKQKIHELWNPMYQAWFPGGESDPQIRVLRVDVTEAEYWEANDSKIIRSIKYLAAAATKGSVDVGEHGKVSVNR
ncbi:pyridoxamine 5'-phosphate oxidase family protein [Telmatobacter sp. DSM 110680]|uniref:Pyridoxamine 5'-phosphate oxidase family protein n=1 Tax=Telmatobacter sp. DSM 110680 TaxID=3036704 RepID=A0AAU7DT74_9BACT